MENFKIIVDILASISVLIAIVSVLVSWYRNTQKPLKIIRTIVHKNDKTTFILVIKNVKPYPVVIKNTDCYRKKKYEIQKNMERNQNILNFSLFLKRFSVMSKCSKSQLIVTPISKLEMLTYWTFLQNCFSCLRHPMAITSFGANSLQLSK